MDEQALANHQRAVLLYGQKRYTESIAEYFRILPFYPDQGYVYGMIALCLVQQHKTQEALEFVKTGLGIAPGDAHLYYIAATITLGIKKPAEALGYIEESIRLEPNNATYWGTLANVRLHQKEWQMCLDSAGQGLKFSADDLPCLNARATALQKLGKKTEAYDTIKDALYFDPENSATHSNLGWALLEDGKPKEALEQFMLSLQLNPTSETAKSGMVEAMKSRYAFYRFFLAYAFWITNKKANTQWFIIIGFFIGYRVILNINRNYPDLYFITFPLIVLYILFAFTTWIIAPLSNLFLRMNRYGRYALDEQETECSDYIGGLLITSLSSLILSLVFKEAAWAMLAIFCFSIMVPVASIFSVPNGTAARRKLFFYTLGIVFIAFLAFLVYASSSVAFNGFSLAYILAFVVFQWVGNAVLIR